VELLVLHPGGLGDTILSLPAIALLRKRFPSARVTVAGNIDHLAPIMDGYAERVISLATLPLHRLYSNEELPPEEIAFWKSYDLIVSWTGYGNSTFARRLRELQPDARIGAWKPGPDESRHVAQLFADSLGIGIPSGNAPTPAPIFIDSKMRAAGRQLLIDRGWNGRDSLAAIHPGAGSSAKRWPISRFIELARHLALRESRMLAIIDGPAEPGLAQQMLQALSLPQVISLAGVPLNPLAAVIRHCGLFIGNDSGLAHLAAALTVPCVVLFGPTSPVHWAPLGPQVTVLRNPKGCVGCASGGNSHTCLENITVEEVLRK
jgi:heptosyltransferase III